MMKGLINDRRFVTFLFIGFVNTVFGYSMYALFMFLGMHYSLAVLAGTILGVLFNFKTTGKFVFNVSNNKLLFRFIGIYAVTYVLNVAALRIFDYYRYNLYLAGLLLILPMAAISFALQRKFVFRGTPKNAAD
jgi:putative flippase GtrA